jgi:Transposase DDE domain
MKVGTGMHRGCDHHQRAQFDEEQEEEEEEARSRDSAGRQGQELILRHEAAHRGRQPLGAGSQRSGDLGKCARQAPAAQHAARRGVQGLWGQRVCWPARSDREQGAAGRGLYERTGAQYQWRARRKAATQNREKSKVRARVEHVFAIIKRQWGFNKVRYRGLQKNAKRAFTALALALANIHMVRGLLMGQVRP